jgi:hypothetical protein
MAQIMTSKGSPITRWRGGFHHLRMRLRHSSFSDFPIAWLAPCARFLLRQGLWIEDLRTPPGQECSNGSLILLAVVLWRTLPGRIARAYF